MIMHTCIHNVPASIYWGIGTQVPFTMHVDVTSWCGRYPVLHWKVSDAPTDPLWYSLILPLVGEKGGLQPATGTRGELMEHYRLFVVNGRVHGCSWDGMNAMRNWDYQKWLSNLPLLSVHELSMLHLKFLHSHPSHMIVEAATNFNHSFYCVLLIHDKSQQFMISPIVSSKPMLLLPAQFSAVMLTV